ncbi:MAG: stage II sporulation protein M [Anaerolineales bacterium]|jgi:uncharacterized membrane protein SpoIIM required for sporulation/ABC-type transport system involved in multi-copper enzyme maturation permease subunit|nr:stage II sporulation protein M [Anaerolineales bacterium]
MFNKLQPMWLVSMRELRDQFRDWRVLAPMVVLTLGFPFLMNVFANQTVDFLNQFGASLIVERFVPFSVMIIGFFPITVSLVVALESFVGEKERGTIEPLLNAPFDDWQLYFAKLLVGAITPLIASYLATGLYLVMIHREGIALPAPVLLFQLLLLTTAHAVLMVSAAIVISAQSTSVKAANLLASFIVIPVAILMQGEAVMLFWGNEDVIWMAIAGVTIISLLLIRVGIAHFQREFLLGREIDVLNLKWMWDTFWSNFRGGAQSVGAWYRKVFAPAFRRTLPAVFLVVLVTGVSVWMGYDWVQTNVSDVLANAPAEEVERLKENFRELPDLAVLRGQINAPFLFFNNTRAVALMLLAGLFSFSVLGILIYMVNIALIGGLYAMLALLGMPAAEIYLAGVLPHGILEIPALLFGGAAVLYVGAGIVTPQVGKSMGEVVIELLADWAKIFIGLILPLLAAAALIETYVTPGILVWALGG